MAMASVSDERIKVQVTHGPKKYHLVLELPPEENHDTLLVSHLMEEVAKVTEVPIKNQRLIVKGKSLTDPNASLKSSEVRDGSKLMLIGRKYSEQDNEFIKQISDIETKVKKIEDKLNDVIKEVEGIQKGFLSSELQEEALKNLSKRVSSCTEEFTKQMECCDALSLSEGTNEIRNKRKRLVNMILDFLQKCDHVSEGIEITLKQVA